MGICPRCGSWIDAGEPYCPDCSYIINDSSSDEGSDDSDDSFDFGDEGGDFDDLGGDFEATEEGGGEELPAPADLEAGDFTEL